MQYDAPSDVIIQLRELVLHTTLNTGRFLEFASWEPGDVVDGHALSSTGKKLYGFYATREGQTTAGTEYCKLYNDTADDSTQSNERLVLVLGAGEYGLVLYSQGRPFSNGVVVSSHSSVSGIIDTAAGNQPRGFAIMGAPR